MKRNARSYLGGLEITTGLSFWINESERNVEVEFIYVLFILFSQFIGCKCKCCSVCIHGHDSHTCAGFEIVRMAATVQRSQGCTHSVRCFTVVTERGRYAPRLDKSRRGEASVNRVPVQKGRTKVAGMGVGGGPILYRVVSQRMPTCLTGWPSHTKILLRNHLGTK